MYNPRYLSRVQYMRSLEKSLDLIQSSVEGEKADAMFYEWLINNIPMGLRPDQRESIRQTLTSIKEDEISHNAIYKEMYKELTNKDVVVQEEEFTPPNSFVEGIIRALNGELNAVKKYREILPGLPSNYYRDQVFNIITDEIRHSSLYNYIYTTIMTA